MPGRTIVHLRRNAVAYVALFFALGGTSYAAATLAPGSVKSRALAKGAVTRSKLASNSITASKIRNGSLTGKDFKRGALIKTLKGEPGVSGSHGIAGLLGATGRQGPAGQDGSASLGAKIRTSGAVSAPKGATTNVPLSGGTWTQSAGELDLLAGSMTIQTPGACTGSFGNTLVVSVDGAAQTFAVAPTNQPSKTLTVPVVVGTLSEPDADRQHTMTAAFANSCTKDGEDYTVNDAKIDVIKFR